MRRLTRVHNNLFVFVDLMGARPKGIVGSRFDVALYLYTEGYDEEEITIAFDELIKHDQDEAHFGMRKKFLYTVDFTDRRLTV